MWRIDRSICLVEWNYERYSVPLVYLTSYILLDLTNCKNEAHSGYTAKATQV